MREQIAQSIVDFNIMTPKERVKWVQSQDYPHTALYIQAIEEAVAAETERCVQAMRSVGLTKMQAVVDAASGILIGGAILTALEDCRCFGKDITALLAIREALEDLDDQPPLNKDLDDELV